jgi:hypothetical protein
VVTNVLKDHRTLIFKGQSVQEDFFLDCLTLRMKAMYSFQMSANTLAMTQCHISEDLNPKIIFLPKIGYPV